MNAKRISRSAVCLSAVLVLLVNLVPGAAAVDDAHQPTVLNLVKDIKTEPENFLPVH